MIPTIREPMIPAMISAIVPLYLGSVLFAKKQSESFLIAKINDEANTGLAIIAQLLKNSFVQNFP